MVNLRPVIPADYPFLYDLLKEKRPEQNISHTHLPTYEEHVAFNDAQPYGEDYIVTVDGKSVGRVYITRQNEVGIHIKGVHASKGYGGEALELIIRASKRPLLANIAPHNVPSQKFFEKHGFSLIQYTYRHP